MPKNDTGESVREQIDRLENELANSLSLTEIKRRLDELCTVWSYLRKADQLDKIEVYKALGIN